MLVPEELSTERYLLRRFGLVSCDAFSRGLGSRRALSESSKGYFHSKAFPFLFCQFHGLALFPPISFSLGRDENHKKVTGINKRQISPFSPLHSSACVAEGLVDLFVIVKASKPGKVVVSNTSTTTALLTINPALGRLLV